VLGSDRLEQRCAVLGGQREHVALEPVQRLLDRRDRRPQVVRNRLDDGGLDGVAPPERLRLERLAGQSLPLARHGEQRRERGQETLPHGERRLLPLGREHGADPAAVDDERMWRVA
jgi:hypothetical protein